ncbi:MAG: hypothetical protein IT416_03870 [Candidatus Pacebacteria bacterium]|nr:hypothetical protein [Candidatus Paceibacterota bacterium]
MDILLLLAGIVITILVLGLTIFLWVYNLTKIYQWMQPRLDAGFRILFLVALGILSAVAFQGYEIIQTIVGLFVMGAGLYLSFEKSKGRGLLILGLYVLRYALSWALLAILLAAGVEAFNFNFSW